MVRAGLVALGLILASGAAYGSAAANIDDELALLQRGIDRAQADDCTGAVPLLKQAVEARAFDQLSEHQQYLAARILAACAYYKRDYPTAFKMSRLATAGPLADKTDWYYRTLASGASEDKEDTSRSLERLVAWPDAVNDLELRTIYSILSDVDGTAEGDARNARIVKALFDAKWRPKDETPERADGLWTRHVRALLKAGNVAEARKVAATILSPDFTIDVHAQKLFDPLLAADPGRYDILKAHKAAVARLKAEAAAAPDTLEPVVNLGFLLYQLDRQDEALALIDAKLAAVKAGKKFTDADKQLNWLYNHQAYVLLALGRVEDAVAAMQTGAHLGEDGGHNVSQTINLADTYYDLGRPAEALKTLADFDPKNASPYGIMAAEEARACAYVQLGDKAVLAKSLNYMRAHAGDAPAVAVQALLCAGEESEAAAMVVKFLGDDAKRDAMLERLHKNAVPAKAPEMPFNTLMRNRWRTLAARPEVIAAVDRFGHILDLPLVMVW